MLQAHSLLWHYLWVAPNILLLFLAVLLWQRRHLQWFPIFALFACVSAAEQLTLYAADVLPSVSGPTFWRIDWACLLIEALIKFVLIAEIFARLFGRYPSVAKTNRLLVRSFGFALALGAAAIAAYSRTDSTFGLISGTHILGQTAFIVEAGLVLFLFLLASYFGLSWDRASFGVTLGLGISASVHLASWALMANGNISIHVRSLLDFLNMATYHLSVLIWCYYLLVPAKSVSLAKDPLPPEHSLEVWNQELERLIHQ